MFCTINVLVRGTCEQNRGLDFDVNIGDLISLRESLVRAEILVDLSVSDLSFRYLNMGASSHRNNLIGFTSSAGRAAQEVKKGPMVGYSYIRPTFKVPETALAQGGYRGEGHPPKSKPKRIESVRCTYATPAFIARASVSESWSLQMAIRVTSARIDPATLTSELAYDASRRRHERRNKHGGQHEVGQEVESSTGYTPCLVTSKVAIYHHIARLHHVASHQEIEAR